MSIRDSARSWWSDFVAWLDRPIGAPKPRPEKPSTGPPPKLSGAPAIKVARTDRIHFGAAVQHFAEHREAELPGCPWDGTHLQRRTLDLVFSSHGVVRDQGATKATWIERVGNIVSEMRRGSRLFTPLSCHGTHAPHPTEPDGLVEAACLHDGLLDYPRNLITAYDVEAIARMVPDGAIWLFFADFCHGGVRPDDVALYGKRALPLLPGADGVYRSRYVEPPIALPTHPSSVVTFDGSRGEPGAGDEHDAPWPHLIQLSAGRSSEPVADARIDGNRCGAGSWSALRALEDPTRSLSQIQRHMHRALVGKSFDDQHPQLAGTAPHRALAFFID